MSRLNFLGIGHTVSLRSAYSSIEKLASITYQQPRFFNNAKRSISYTLLYDNSLNVNTFASHREEASVQISQKFSKSLTGLFRAAYRRDSISNVVIPVLLIPQFVQPVRIGILSANLVQDRRNNAGNPSRGMYNTIDIGLADRVFGSQRNFGRVLARNATYYQVRPHLILARQTEFGIIAPFSAPAGVTEQDSVPLPETVFRGRRRFAAGFPLQPGRAARYWRGRNSGRPYFLANGFAVGRQCTFFQQY